MGWEALKGHQATELELTKICSGLTIFLSLMGRGSTKDNPGSAWAVWEQSCSQLNDLPVAVSELAGLLPKHSASCEHIDAWLAGVETELRDVLAQALAAF